MNFAHLASDGTASGTRYDEPEERAVAGEELWWPPGVGTAGIYVTEQTALRSAAFLAALNCVASDVAILPLCVHQELPDGTHREADDHPVAELWGRTPNGETIPARFKQAWVAHALQYRGGYCEIVRSGRGAPSAMHLLDPERTQPKRVDGRLGYEIEGGARWLEAANVLHLAGLGYDGLNGYPFVRLLRQNLGLSIAGETFAADYFANGSEPGGVIETPQKLDKDARERLREGWERRHGGAGNRHKTAVLEQGAKFNPTSADPESSQLVETRKFQVLEAIRAWRVPPHKAGDFSQSHLANLEASNLDYLTTALAWWLVSIEQECNLKLFSRAEWKAGYYVEHDVSFLLRGDIVSRYNSYSVALRDGWLSRDEVRRKENLNPIGTKGGGSTYTVQAQMIPLGQVGKAKTVPTPGDPIPPTEPDADDTSPVPSPPTEPLPS